MQKISAVIFDVDNTLYDFTAFYSPAFQAMLDVIEEKSGISQQQLKSEFREVHQRAGTSEYVFAVQELPSLQKLHPNEDMGELYKDAIQAFRDTRKKHLTLYDGVYETIKQLKDAGVRVVAYTESPAFHAMARLKTLGLDGLLDVVYSMPDHDMPPHTDLNKIRRKKDKNGYGFEFTEMRNTPKGVLKPNPESLEAIIDDLNIDKDKVLYVGDHLMKDVAMAKNLGINAAHAAYGSYMGDSNYELLKEVTFWTDEMLAKEKKYHDQPLVAPDVTLKSEVGELFNHFQFIPYKGVPKKHSRFTDSPFCKSRNSKKPNI